MQNVGRWKAIERAKTTEAQVDGNKFTRARNARRTIKEKFSERNEFSDGEMINSIIHNGQRN